MKPAKVIRDPIHGNISLSELEVELVDTEQFQRLRNIKQNGFCYLVYPAMNSTRFEHSLGVMHLAGILSYHLNLREKDKNLLRVAGLLHDIGHCAFSHTLDGIIKKSGHSHEENSSRIILKTEISDMLKKHGINPKEVSNLINGKGSLSKIISSEIDIDKMDYLLRDSYYAGVAYGTIDLERIIYSMRIIKDEIVINERGLEAVESLLIGRNMMYQTVYRHHTKRIAEAMFIKAVNTMIGLKKLTYSGLIKIDDIDLIEELRNSKGYPKEMIDRIDKRKLFKTVLQEKLTNLPIESRKYLENNIEKIEKEIARGYKIKEGYVFINLPKAAMSEFKIRVEYDNELKFIDEVSNLAKSLEKSDQEKLTVNLIVDSRYVSKMKDFCIEDYL